MVRALEIFSLQPLETLDWFVLPRIRQHEECDPGALQRSRATAERRAVRVSLIITPGEVRFRQLRVSRYHHSSILLSLTKQMNADPHRWKILRKASD